MREREERVELRETRSDREKSKELKERREKEGVGEGNEEVGMLRSYFCSPQYSARVSSLAITLFNVSCG